MYDVNAGVPKTLIQFVIRWVANERVRTWTEGDAEQLRETLFAILDTPISPELLPASGSGAIAQITEAAIGPYELHDFFLYHFVRHGARPHRVLDLAREAFGQRYALSKTQALAARVSRTVLPQPVQAFLYGGWSQGGDGGALSARRLAHAIGCGR